MAEAWGSPVERERRRRINLALWAYAYEAGDPLVDDVVYDREAYLVDLSVDTGRADLDAWFREHYKPYTGQWAMAHPEIEKVRGLYERIVSLRDGPVLPGATRRRKRASLRGAPQGRLSKVHPAG